MITYIFNGSRITRETFRQKAKAIGLQPNSAWTRQQLASPSGLQTPSGVFRTSEATQGRSSSGQFLPVQAVLPVPAPVSPAPVESGMPIPAILVGQIPFLMMVMVFLFGAKARARRKPVPVVPAWYPALIERLRAMTPEPITGGAH